LKRTPFFLGAHDLILDPKNRLSIPTLIRKNFDPADEGSLFVHLKGSVPWLYTMGHFRRLVKKQLSPGLMPSELQKSFTYLTLSLGAEVDCDAAGRVVLPESILTRANLGREVTLVGVQDHLELFSRDRWRELRNKLIAQSEIIEAWAQESLRPPAQEQKTQPGPRRDESKD
jgi:MraZ protein